MRSDHPPLTAVMDLLLDAVCVVDRDGRYLYVNAGFERIMGYRADEVIGAPMIERVHPDDRERTLQAAREIMAGEPKLHFQNRYVRKDGRVVDIQWSAHWSDEERVRIAVGHDITELKRAETMQAALLAISEAAHAEGDLQALFRRIHRIIGRLLPAANFFVALRDQEHGMVEFPYFVDEHDEAPAPLSLETPTLSNEVIRSGQALLLTPDTLAELHAHQEPVIGHAALDWLGVPLGTANGVIGALVVQSYHSETRYTSLDKQLLQFVSTQVASAIERKRNQAWLEHLVGHDALTGLPNRNRFHERLEQALETANRDSLRLGLLYLDLDGFKRINDRHGHDLGDQLLREAGERIRQCVRQTDMVARLGGDEFVVLLYGIAHPGHATAVAEAIRTALERPFLLEGQAAHISASIGVALHPEDGEEKKPLLRHADNAMYAAKREGGNRLAANGIQAG
ncbi:diguanylate cyclase [Luteimonas sp. SX5]|uniref:Diguanylate cyclase n=1 Tax=Luteimonas galliterrae TaxID=2940486 RepID=A0ABT0MEV0_9GAMM|nr:GGDEF domain-containing protein [Luteimonas galliterrae]MCL1633396.1 diguanylate cyclase [Luteimonas galliterrae]